MAKVVGAIDCQRLELRPNLGASAKITLRSAPDASSSYTLQLPSTAPTTTGMMLTSNSSEGTAVCDWSNDLNAHETRLVDTDGRKMAFDLSLVGSNTTRNLVMPDRDVELGMIGAATGFGEFGTGNLYSFTGATMALVVERAGYGYILGQRVSWSAGQSVTLTQYTVEYVSVSSAGQVQVSAAELPNVVPLFRTYWAHTLLVQPMYRPWWNAQNATTLHGNGAWMETTNEQTRQVSLLGDDVLYSDGIAIPITATGPDAKAVFTRWQSTATGIWYQVSADFEWTSYMVNNGILYNSHVGKSTVYRVVAVGLVGPDGSEQVRLIAMTSDNHYATEDAMMSAIRNEQVLGPSGEFARLMVVQLGYVCCSRLDSTTHRVSKIINFRDTMNPRLVYGPKRIPTHTMSADLDGGQYQDGGHTKLAGLRTSTAAPQPSDDVQAHRVGTLWVNSSNKQASICVQNNSGNAVWVPIQNRPAVSTQSTSGALGVASEGIVRVSCASGAVTLTLPVNAPSGVRFQLVKTDTSTNAMIVQPASGDTITYKTDAISCSGQGDVVVLTSDGSRNWMV